MRLALALFLAAILAALLGVVAARAPGDETGRFALRGTVVSVADGDTVTVRLTTGQKERVRLIGIDAPELSPSECFGRRSRTRARQLAHGARVQLVGDGTQDTRDRYRRLLAYVVLAGGRDLGRSLIAEGLGRVYVYDRPFQRLAAYRSSERSAKSRRRGLWSGLCEG